MKSRVRRRRPFRRRCAVAGLTIAALALSGCDFSQFSRRAAERERERSRLAADEQNASQCVANLSARNPQQDAEQDAERGDQTPIGLSFTPHDPSDTTTYYEDACNGTYDGSYRSTGKWFTYSHEGFSFFAPAKSYPLCRGKARDYARSYNQRMVEIAPAAIRTFCRNQKPLRSARL